MARRKLQIDNPEPIRVTYDLSPLNSLPGDLQFLIPYIDK